MLVMNQEALVDGGAVIIVLQAERKPALSEAAESDPVCIALAAGETDQQLKAPLIQICRKPFPRIFSQSHCRT
jgi:hypothetical protein